MQDLIDSIDEYNEAVKLRNDPISQHAPGMAEAVQRVVDSHHDKFVRQLEATGGGHDS